MTNRQYIKLFFTLSAFYLILAGCYKDKGNYSYHPINEVSITAETDSFTVFQFDSLRIEPIIEESMPNPAALRYHWGIYNSGAGDGTGIPNGLSETISTERVLDIQVSQVPRGRAYDLVFTVTDTTTGVSFKHNYKLTVNAALSEGWMLLTTDGQQGDVDFILPGDIVRNKVYSSVNADYPIPGDPKVVSQVGGMANLHFVLYPGGGYLLDKNTFSVVSDFKQIFYRAPEPLMPEDVILSNFAGAAYLFNNGDLYTMALLYGAKKFGDRIAGNYKLAPFAMPGIYQDVFFDAANHRFLALPMYGTSFTAFPAKSASDAFDLNQVDGTLMTVQSTVNAQFVALFSNIVDDSVGVYTVAPRSGVVAAGFHKAPPSSLLAQGTQFASSPILPQIYFAIDNDIYLYDMAAHNSRLIFSFPAAESLEILKMNGNNGLVASTFDGTESRMYFFTLASTGNIENNEPDKVFTGFDHIIDFHYKTR